jgi:hypothetical protein
MKEQIDRQKEKTKIGTERKLENYQGARTFKYTKNIQ